MTQTEFVHIAKKILPFVPEYFAEFSTAPEFSCGVSEKHLRTGQA
jgi:hypothetical protein